MFFNRRMNIILELRLISNGAISTKYLLVVYWDLDRNLYNCGLCHYHLPVHVAGANPRMCGSKAI